MVHVAYGYGMFTGGLGAHYGVERAGCCAVQRNKVARLRAASGTSGKSVVVG